MKIVSILIIMLCVQLANAQTPGYVHFGTVDGLPSNLVYCALQDRAGYLWFGTDKGLARFDGEHFKTYGVEDGLPDPEVLDLYEDLQGRLWVVCFRQKPAYRLNGIFFNEKTDTTLVRFSHYNSGFNFFENEDSTLWLTGGLGFRWAPGQGKIDTLTSPHGISRIVKIGSELLGLYGGYNLTLLSKDGNFSKRLYEINPPSWPSIAISANRLMYAFSNETLLLEYSGGSVRQVASSPIVFQKLYTDRRGRFWGCLPGRGAVCFDNPAGNFSNPVWYLPGRKVTNVYEDKLGNIWFLTSGEGLFFLPQNPVLTWQQTDGLPSSNLLSLASGVDGQVYVGDDIGNVIRLSGGKLVEKSAFGTIDGSNFVRQILPIGSQNFWAVTDEGFYMKEGERTKKWVEMLAPDNIKARSAPKAIASTGDGKYWLGSNLGVAIFKDNGSLPAISSNALWKRVTTLATDAENNLWKGGTEGLFSQADNFQLNWGEHFPLLKSRIVAIHPGCKNQIWVVTPESGLLEVGTLGGKITSVVPVSDRLKQPLKDIKNLFAAPNGSLLLATSRGILLIDNVWHVNNFTSRQGLASDEVNDVLFVNDTLWAATASGLSMLVLNKTDSQPNHFRTTLTEFRFQINDRDFILDFSGKENSAIHICLPHDAHLPEAMFAGLNRSPGEALRFRHEIRKVLLPFPWYTFNNLFDAARGQQDDFDSETSNLHLGANLPPGRYHFRSVATLFSGAEGLPVQWEVTVLPHWAQTIWPWMLLLAGLGFWLRRFYQLRMRVYKMDISVSQLKLQALRAQINPHFVGNSINAIQKFFYPPNPEKASDYVHLFTQLLRKTLYFSELDFIPFTDEVTYNREYLDMIKLRYTSGFEYELEGVESIPPDVPFPAMFLQPILENATIHGLAQKGKSVLKVHFFMEKNRLICTVTDNGAGIKASLERKHASPGTRVSKGIGILENKANMLNRLHKIDLKIEWNDLSETLGAGVHGTEVRVSFLPNKQIKIV